MRVFLIFLFLLNAFTTVCAGYTPDDYIRKYAALAIRQQEKYRIPASITLAQGMLETGYGESLLARKYHNHFGIRTVNRSGSVRYRRYLSVADSFEDHSVVLVSSKRYKSLFTYEISDYKSWACGLQRCGYAEDPQYAKKLIYMIKKYKLFRFDSCSSFASDG